MNTWRFEEKKNGLTKRKKKRKMGQNENFSYCFLFFLYDEYELSFLE